MNVFSFPSSRSINLKSKNQSHSFSRSNTAEYGSLVWTFDSRNHYLHPRLANAIYSKAAIWTLAIAVSPMPFLFLTPKYVEYVCMVLLNAFVLIPFLWLVILSFNRDASGFIVKSSEFWIKIVYAIVKTSLQFARYHLVLRHTETDTVPQVLGYTLWILRFISEPSSMVAFGGLDAIPRLTHKWKAMLMGIAAVFWTLEAIQYQFLEPRELDYVMTISATKSEISLDSLLSNASGMMAIFLWKQAVDVVRNKNRCISITYRPYLQWTESENNSKSIDQKMSTKSDAIAAKHESAENLQESRRRGFSILAS